MHVLERIGVISLAKIMGMSGLAIGLLIGLVYGGFIMIVGAGAAGAVASGEAPDAGPLAVLGIGGGLAMIIFIPLMYGALSFVTGLVYGFVLNVMLRIGGGLELELRKTR